VARAPLALHFRVRLAVGALLLDASSEVARLAIEPRGPVRVLTPLLAAGLRARVLLLALAGVGQEPSPAEAAGPLA
jgi:hypothetical protein